MTCPTVEMLRARAKAKRAFAGVLRAEGEGTVWSNDFALMAQEKITQADELEARAAQIEKEADRVA